MIGPALYGDEPGEWSGVCSLIWGWLRPEVPQKPESRAMLALAYAIARREAEAEERGPADRTGKL